MGESLALLFRVFLEDKVLAGLEKLVYIKLSEVLKIPTLLGAKRTEEHQQGEKDRGVRNNAAVNQHNRTTLLHCFHIAKIND